MGLEVGRIRLEVGGVFLEVICQAGRLVESRLVSLKIGGMSLEVGRVLFEVVGETSRLTAL